MPPFGSSGEHETHLPARESSWSVRRKVSHGNMKEVVSVPHGNMKEVVSVPRLSFPRVYSDSMLCLRTSANAILSPSSSLSSSSSSISSSSSPSFVSPDSITSDSSIHSKFLLEVSPDSSSLSNFSSLSITSNSTSHNFSSLSITSNSTSQPVSHSTDILGVKLSHPLFQSASLPLPLPPGVVGGCGHSPMSSEPAFGHSSRLRRAMESGCSGGRHDRALQFCCDRGVSGGGPNRRFWP